METFIPAYMQALTTRLSIHADPKALSQSLLSATKLMFENNRPDRTLMEVFDEAFFPALGLDKRAVQASIDTFYTEDFPKLKSLTQYRPEAVELVKESIHRDYRIGIATNPLFPMTAIKQRLAWAGLSVENFPFAVVPSYETFHFAKPNPAYFAELIGYLGWPDEPIIMVGNDQEMDIVAAQEAGLSVYWTTTDENNQWIGPGEAPPKGKLEDIFNWVDSESQANLKPSLHIPSAIMAILRSTPAVLANLCASLPLDTWTKRPESGEWCPTEILCHLRDVEVEVNLPRIEKLLQEANPFIAGRDTDPWAVEREYIKQAGPSALRDFTAYRIKLLTILESMDPQDWERPARHAIFGPTNLKELVDILAGHDRLHLKQIHHTIKEITRDYALV
jgi:FMN phosphatase YigB (HAD superfamily)